MAAGLNPELVEGLKLAAQGNRVRGFPCCQTSKAACGVRTVLNTCRHRPDSASKAFPLGASAARGSGHRDACTTDRVAFTDEPHAAGSAGGTERFCFSP